jgi:hypothetical protein
MKFFLLILTDLALLATTGCIFPGHRDRSDDRASPGFGQHKEHSAGVDHGEYPGDMNHGESRQP